MLTLRNYRRAAVPLLAVQTADPAEVLRLAVKEAQNGQQYPVLRWDICHGITGANETGAALASTTGEAGINPNGTPPLDTGGPFDALCALERLPDLPGAKRSIVVMIGLTPALEKDPACLQALWNLRDVLTRQTILLVFTAPLGWRNILPDDIVVAESPLPDRETLDTLTRRICKDAKIDTPEDTTSHVDALTGISAFAAEQTLALSIDPETRAIDIETLRRRKRQQISETEGLTVYEGMETLESLAGLSQAKRFLQDLIRGKANYGAVCWFDEFEKAVSANKTDSSGVTQDQVNQFLSYMDKPTVDGLLLVGVPGGGKSAIVKCTGNEAGRPTIQVDIGGMKGSLVGESEARIRKALSVLTAISGGRLLVLATCNSIDVLTPEMRRRFNLGIMFFDYPDSEERAAILDLHLSRYGLDKTQPMPDMIDWTGAEIRQACDLADKLSLPLAEAARYVVPVSQSSREQMTKLRKEASGRFLSASTPGLYQYCPTTQTTNRRIDLES